MFFFQKIILWKYIILNLEICILIKCVVRWHSISGKDPIHKKVHQILYEVVAETGKKKRIKKKRQDIHRVSPTSYCLDNCVITIVMGKCDELTSSSYLDYDLISIVWKLVEDQWHPCYDLNTFETYLRIRPPRLWCQYF